MPPICDLPRELIDGIISNFSSQEPPSAKCLQDKPTASVLTSTNPPLKGLAQTCQHLRHWVLPHLNSHLKASVTDIAKLIEFARVKQLKGKVKSLVVFARIRGYGVLLPWMTTLMDAIEPESLTLMLPPKMYWDLLPSSLSVPEVSIRYLVLRLAAINSSAGPTTSPNIPQSILSIRRWTELSFNRSGPSIKGHTMLDSVTSHNQHVHALYSLLPHSLEGSLQHRLSRTLTSFDFIAVFAHYWVGNLILFLHSLVNLKRFRTQVGPSPGNTISGNSNFLYDQFRWHYCESFKRQHRALASYLRDDEVTLARPSLTEWTILDYADPGLQVMIDMAVAPKMDGWKDKGNGHWERVVQSGSVSAPGGAPDV